MWPRATAGELVRTMTMKPPPSILPCSRHGTRSLGLCALASWPAIHETYDKLWEKYPLDKHRHALATLLDLLGAKKLTAELWASALAEVVARQRYVAEQTYVTRKKDYDNPFRQMTFAGPEEMEAVLGTAEANSFVKQVRQETEAFAERIEAVKRRG